MSSRESCFGNDDVPFELLRRRAFNSRWAEQDADVIPLTAADPDFPCAQVIRDALVNYARSGVYSYGPPEGLMEFRAAACDVLRKRKGMSFAQPDHVLAVGSAARGMAIVTRALLRPGDEALVFDPVDFLFSHTVSAAGGVAVRIPIEPLTGEIDILAIERAITPRTRLLTVCNPHNPTGRVIRPDELRKLGEIACEHDIAILSDEIWSDIVYSPNQHVAFASLSPEVARRTYTVHGLSKTFGLAGLRIGFVHVGDEQRYHEMVASSDVHSTVEGVSTMSQIGAIAALRDAWPWAEAFVRHLHSQRDIALRHLREVEGLQVRAPEGCYVLFPDVGAWGDEAELARTILREYRVAVVPGTTRWFGSGAKGHIRLTFATSEAVLLEGLSRVCRGLRALR